MLLACKFSEELETVNLTEVDNLQGGLLDNSVGRSQTMQQQGRTWPKDTKDLTINQRFD